jgi:hypothetical protein
MLEDSIKKEAIRIIGKYFGNQTADLYANFYDDKTDEVVLASIEEMLVDFIGKEKTEQEIKHLKLAITPIQKI